MSRSVTRAVLLIAAGVLFAVPASAQAATVEVCPAGPPQCDFALLSDAIADPGTVDGDTINVAAGTYVEETGVDVDKALTIVGAGSGETIIDGNGAAAPGQTGQLEVRTGSGQDVSVSGLTVRDPVADGSLRIGIFAKSMGVPGPAHAFTDVAIEGSGATSGEEYGLWTFHSTADLTFDQGSISGTRYNPILIEQPIGSTTVSGSDIARGEDCCGVFFMTSLPGESAAEPQRLLDNDLTGGASVTFSAAFVASSGGFDAVEIAGNRIEGAGITLANGGSGDGSAAAITAPVVAGNIVEGAGSGAGVNLRGLVTDALVEGNSLTGFAAGVRAVEASGAPTHVPEGAQLRANRIASNDVGVDNQTAAGVDAQQNWWGCNEGPAGADCNGTNGPVTADPWLTLALAGPAALGAGDTVPYEASVAGTSDGGVAAAPAAFPETEVSFAAEDGTIDSPKDLVASVASSDFTAPMFNGPVEVSTSLDAETVSQTVAVSGAPLAPTRLVARPMVIDDQPGPIELRPIGEFTADLTNAETGEPIAGREIVFSSASQPGGRVLCKGVTNAAGRATCRVELIDGLEAILNLRYTAHYAGDANTQAAAGTAKLIRLLGLLELL